MKTVVSLDMRIRFFRVADSQGSSVPHRPLSGTLLAFGLALLIAGCGSPGSEAPSPEEGEPLTVAPTEPIASPARERDWLSEQETPELPDPWAEFPAPSRDDSPSVDPQSLDPLLLDPQFAERLPLAPLTPQLSEAPADRTHRLTAPSEESELGPRLTPGTSAMRAPAPHPQVTAIPSEEAPGPEVTVREFPSEELAGTREPYDPQGDMPAGVEHRQAEGYTIVPVFYGTDRQRAARALAAYRLVDDPVMLALLGTSGALALLMAVLFLLRRRPIRALAAFAGAMSVVLVTGYLIWQGRLAIEKEGVTYTGARGELVRGRCLVTVPDTHERGRIERPVWHRLEVTEDLRRHLVVLAAHELPKSEFHRQLAEAVDTAEHRDLFVFIHGYNVDFESAVRRTAQIAVDLPFRGVPICYSWPSQGSLLGYTIDENNVTWTVTHLKQFLRELVAHSRAESIHLVAHSMGNRALTAALREFSLEMGTAAEMFDRVVLAAPDVDADHFRRDLAPHLLNTARHVTLYASSGDRALIASKQVHGYPRAGESGPGMVVLPGIETIDVSGVDLSLLGHSYYGESQPLLHDLFHLVRKSLPAAQRSWLQRREHGALEYWHLPGTTATAPSSTLR